MKQSILSTILFLTFQCVAHSQQNPLFDDTSLPEIRISINPVDLDYILEPGNEDSDEEFPADFLFDSESYQATELNVGFRLRGNTSRASQKKSFKVAFNAFEKGRDLKGLEKLNLNGEHNDPSIIRSKICWDLMDAMGVVAPRANHVKLFINDEYKGLYINVEHIDEEFAEDRFGNKDGNLYKCLYPADLSYKGENPDLYKEAPGGRRTYELTTNEEEDDYSDLAKFIKVLNKTSLLDFEEEIEKVFDVSSYLKILAVEVMVGHWDNYGFNQNNYYLYHNPDDDKFYYIPYDLDNTLGISFFSDPDFASADMYKWYDASKTRPLTQRLMRSPKYQVQFSLYMEELLTYYSPDELFPKIDHFKQLIQEAAESDTYKGLDWGFTNEDFNLSYTETPDYSFVKYGLKEFISKRYQSTLSQLIITSIPTNKTWTVYPNPGTQHFSISAPEGQYQVSIYGIDGRFLHEIEVRGSMKNINVPESIQTPGTYFIKLVPEHGTTQTFRWILKE